MCNDNYLDHVQNISLKHSNTLTSNISFILPLFIASYRHLYGIKLRAEWILSNICIKYIFRQTYLYCVIKNPLLKHVSLVSQHKETNKIKYANTNVEDLLFQSYATYRQKLFFIVFR